VTQGHLSRILRRSDYKGVSPELAGRVAQALDLPIDYFPEFREGAVIARVKQDSRYRDRLYDELGPRPAQRASRPHTT
jgi:hypothetical protein